MGYQSQASLAQSVARLTERALKTGLPPRGVTFDGATDDTGTPPPWLIPALESYARGIGYRVMWYNPARLGLPDTSGMTVDAEKVRQGFPALIMVNHDMSPASRARVLAHELAHADHIRDPAYRPRASRQAGEDPAEEVYAEMTSGLIMTAFGASDGRFTAQYLGGRSTALIAVDWVRSEQAAVAAAEAVIAHARQFEVNWARDVSTMIAATQLTAKGPEGKGTC